MSAFDKSSGDGLPSAEKDELKLEREVEALYRQHLRDKAIRPVQPEGPRSWWWTRTVTPKVKVTNGEDLIGRVALTKPVDDLGGATEFYFGDTFARIGGVEFYNWRNPLGRSFFDPESGGPTIDNVAVVRTFDRHGRDLRGFVDDVVCDDPPIPFFRNYPLKPLAPVVPALDYTEKRRRAQHSRVTDEPRVAGDDSNPFIRAESLLRERLLAPRKPNLSSALSTLQPEQYRLTSEPANKSIVIEGGPGTGKSIIASHRAGYLISDDPEHENTFQDRLLVVGPTLGYTDYVGEVIYELTGDSPRVGLCALAQLDLLEMGPDAPSGIPRLVATSLPTVFRTAWIRLKASSKTAVTVEELYEYLRGNGSLTRPLTHEPHWSKFLKPLPPYEEAKSRADLVWLVAAMERILPGYEAPPRIGHIIVDEAQDVTPGQWTKLRKLNEGNTWTILGDLNQRRTDHTFKKWSDVLKAIGLPPNTEPVKLTRGYRSTQPILELANRLLGSAGTSPLALNPDGPSPNIVETTLERLIITVTQQVDRLLGKYPGGTVAVISAMPGPIRAQMNRTHTDPKVTVLSSNEARGLEFDAVIVAEPTDFPRNDRRYGPLYTALTRPNKELVIVHTRGIPPDLEQRQPVPVTLGTVKSQAAAAVAASTQNAAKNKKSKSRRSSQRRGRRSRKTPPPAGGS